MLDHSYRPFGKIARVDKLNRIGGTPRRQNFAAASLATIGYVMLYATAVSLDDSLVSLLAARHLRDYTRIMTTISRLMPHAVLDYLRQDGLPVRDEMLPGIVQALEAAWEGAAARRAPQPA